MMREDGRSPSSLRQISVKVGTLEFALGSCLIKFGKTQVLTSASVEGKVPPFLKGSGKGWITAEYGMIPASCKERVPREASRGKVGGRTAEIQRLIGRSLRSVTDLTLLGERTFWIDVDVIQADGGTRTAGITGSFISLGLAIEKLRGQKILTANPFKDYLAAVSVGMIHGRPCLDLSYAEDSEADVDMNVVMTASGRIVEIQGCAERDPFTQEALDAMLLNARGGIKKLIQIEKRYIRIP